MKSFYSRIINTFKQQLGLSTGGRRLGSNPCLGCLMAGREVGVLITAETCDITLMSDDVTGKIHFRGRVATSFNVMLYPCLDLCYQAAKLAPGLQ
ncbi:unnamed protein product [Timema podura]|uniref:Uncharacterized protein n=1 Tax=Timema podura TaxID=61482 RepID=A0ABN7NMD9_TIMPD|nr:unnamed protein product [Timema podura]